MRSTWMFVALLVGCGPSEAEHAAEFTSAYCSWLLDCEDPAVLTFDGIQSFEDCEALIAPEATGYGTTCKYKGGNSKACIRAMNALSCPEDASFSMPPECSEVYLGCTFGESSQPAAAGESEGTEE